MNDMPSIKPSLARIDRANESIINLQTRCGSFIDSRPYTAATEPDHNPRTRGFRITHLADIPLQLRVLVGEIAHHLRAAFDLLIYQLMLDAGISDPERLEQCAFPVLVELDLNDPNDRRKYENVMRRKVDGICASGRTVVESLQPCANGSGASSFLAQIDTLDNTDKHRLLLALIASVPIGGFNFREADGSVTTLPHHSFVPLQRDAVIKFTTNNPDVDVDLKLPLQVAFGEPGIVWCQPVVSTLQNLSDIARRTIHLFERDFVGIDSPSQG